MLKIILILTFLTTPLLSATNFDVRVGDKNFKIKSKDIRGVDHLSHYQIQKYILRESKHNSAQGIFTSDNFNLIYQKGSFFIVLEDWSGKMAAQLNLPVTQEQGTTYFPAISFFKSLDTLGLFTVSFASDMEHVLLVSKDDVFAFKPLPKKPSYGSTIKVGEKVSFGNSMSYRSQNPFSSSFKSLNKELLKSLREMKPEELNLPESKAPVQNLPTEKIKIPKEAVDKPGGSYLIPKGLIRKELEEIENK